MSRIEFQIENARLLAKLCEAGTVVKTFDQWKEEGRWVKKGEKAKCFRVRSGNKVVGINPITGEDRVEPVFKLAYGFTADQVR